MHRCMIRPCAWRISRQLQVSRGHVRLASGLSAARTSGINEQNVGNKRLGRKRSGRYDGQDKQREQNTQDLIFLDDLVATLEAHRDYNRASVIRKFQQNVDDTTLPFKRPSLNSASSEKAETSYEKGEDEVDTNARSSTSARGPGPSEGPVRRITVDIASVRKILGTKAPTRRISGTKALARKIFADLPLVREVSGDIPSTADKRRHGPHPRQWPADSVQNVEQGTKTETGFVRSVDPLEYTAAVIPITQSWKWTGAVPSRISTPWAPYVEDSTGDSYERSITVESRWKFRLT